MAHAVHGSIYRFKMHALQSKCADRLYNVKIHPAHRGICDGIGAVLILSALLLFLHNRQEDVQAGQEAESLLENVEAVIETKKIKVPVYRYAAGRSSVCDAA